MRRYLTTLIVLSVVALIAACGGEETAPSPSNGSAAEPSGARDAGRPAGEFKKTGQMGNDRQFHSAVLLDDGRVLVIGGGGRGEFFGGAVHTSAKVYDPETEEWAPTGSMSVQRRSPIVGLLPDGTVLAAGAKRADATIQKTAEIWDPLTGTWVPTGSLSVKRDEPASLTLEDGRVMVIGGVDGSEFVVLETVELFDPATGA